MKFESQICTTKEQSERLLALGLKKETADICIRPDNTLIPIQENSFIYHNLENAIQEGYSPAWSLHRLIEILDVWYLDLNFHNFSDAYEQVISYLEERVKGGFINKEYLEQ
jgi:hypothetical protein